MLPLPERPWLSLMVNGSNFAPEVVAKSTVAVNVNTLLPEVTSPPLAPSSKNIWLAEPPIAVRSATTTNPVLVGLVPGVTVTVNVEISPGRTEVGFEAPAPDGFDDASTVREIDPLPVRVCGAVSVIVKGRLLLPPLVPLATVALNEKTLSAAGGGPPLSSSQKRCRGLSPLSVTLSSTVFVVVRWVVFSRVV